MKEFNIVNIGDFVDLRQGFAINAKSKHYISNEPTTLHLLRIADMRDDNYEIFVKEDIPNNFIANDNDIIYTRTGQVGLVFRNKTGVVHNNCFTVTPRDPNTLNKEYLYYVLKHPSFYRTAVSLASGSAQPDLSHGAFKSIKIHLPHISIQKKIAKILQSLDAKIKVNNEINDNLEQQAQALYKSWFIDNYQTEWPEYSLDEVTLKITDGVHNTVIDTPNGEYYLLSCKNIKNRRLNISASDRRIDEGTFNKLRKRTMLSKGDILLSSVGTIGELMLLNDDPHNYEFQRSVAIIKPNPEYISSYYLYETLISQIDKITNTAHGAVQQCIFLSDLKEYTINLADKALISRYDIIVKPFFDEITKREKEIARLTSLRDSLLPKLMSGELKINEIDC